MAAGRRRAAGSPLAAAALALLAFCGPAAAAGRGKADATAAHVGHEDQSISELIRQMHPCFLGDGAPGTPANISVKMLGTLQIWKLCCSNTSVGGLDVQSNITSTSTQWSGDTKLTITLGRLATECQAQWTLDSRIGHSYGNFSMNLGTEVEPFLRLAVGLQGDPISVGDDSYPWPGNATDVACNANFQVKDLHFSGSASWILRILGSTALLLQGLLRTTICSRVEEAMPGALSKLAAQARAEVEPFIKRLPGDLDPPALPPAAGRPLDLRSSGQLAFVHHLLQQGLQTGDLARLIDHATNGTGAVSRTMGQDGVKLASVDIAYPLKLSMGLVVEGAGVEGVHTIDELDLLATDSAGLSFVFGQRRLNISTSIRALTSLPSGPGATQTALSTKSLIDTLMERFRLRLALSNLNVAIHTDLLINQGRLVYLDEGTVWYSPACVPSLVQNVSVLGVDVRVTVEEFEWVSTVAPSAQLEADFDRSVNNLLRYLNAPMMQPTVSRLVRSLAAGRMRDAANEQLQAWLARPSTTPCILDRGMGSPGGAGLLAAVGIACCLAAAVLARWAWCSPRLVGKRPGRHCAALLASGGLCLFFSGFLDYPFRAGMRMHGGGDGKAGQDIIQYVYVMDLKDPMGPMPGAVAATTASILFAVARVSAVVAAATIGPGPILGRCIHCSAALGSWGLVLPYIFAGTQITSFYARILQFGDAFLDMGVQINAGFYLACLGLYLCDAATLAAYNQCSAKTPQALCGSRSAPSRSALAALALALAALLVAPWLKLWSHRYSGLMGSAMHFQAGGLTRSTSIMDILGSTQDWLLDPRDIAVGAYLIQLFLVVHVVVAPAAHAALALYVGASLRLRRPVAALPVGTACCPAAEARTHYLGYALLLTRMWSGADAFAATMFAVVPDLGGQLWMMSREACDQIQPALDRAGEECNAMASNFNAGLAVLFAAGLAVRLLAEVCAHRPLRGSLHSPVSDPGRAVLVAGHVGRSTSDAERNGGATQQLRL